MNFYYPISQSTDDIHCDNEVYFILKNKSQRKKFSSNNKRSSIVINQTNKYYFMPIQESNSSTEENNVTDNSSILFVSDLQTPSKFKEFNDYFNMNSTTVNKSNNYSITDADLAAFFISTTTSNDSLNTLDDVFLNHMTDSIIEQQQQTIGPPPGFENFRFNSSSTSSDLLTNDSVSSSDTVNFSQLLQSTTVDKQQQQQAMIENIRSSSHSSLTSDEQSRFFPSYATSQMYSTTKPSSTMITTNSASKPNGLSLTNNRLSSSSLIPNSTNDSPIENENNGGISSNSFFSNGHTDFSSTKFPTTTIRTSSSTSSSSSIDDALIQLSQQQYVGNGNKLFNNESTSIFHHFSSLPSKVNIEKEQEQAVHDNINFLASMTLASTDLPQQNTKSLNIQELMSNLNELCYKGFDELNALIQEERWVQNYMNTNSSSPTSPSIHSNGSNCCSSRILIVPEYFIFKCKKVELTASHVFELLANGKVELRLQDLMFVFKSWKEAISNAELIHNEEENKLRLSTEHPQSFYMTDKVLQSAFDRVSLSIRQLCHATQQARAAFQYATLNVFQISSRQQNQSQFSTNSTNIAQIQTIQQPKSSSMHRSNGSIRTIP